MSIEIKGRGIVVNLSDKPSFLLAKKDIESAFNYKSHRYVHIVTPNKYFPEEFFLFLKELKKLPIFLMVESPLPNNIEIIKRLYASGADIAVFLSDEGTNTDLIEEVKEIFPKGMLIFKEKSNKEANFSESLEILKKMPFLIEDSLFEPIKRKIWIDISNLRRKLRVKEVFDSYNSSGL